MVAVELKPKPTDPVVFGFLDYREYLRALYDSRREASSVFSYRFMAQRLDVDAGQLARILQGKLHLPQRALAAAIQLCRLEGREAAYFEELVRHGRAKNPEDAARSLERLEALKVPAPREVLPDQAAFYARWHHTLVRALAAMDGIPQDPGTLAASSRAPLSREQVEESLRLLERLGLLEREAGTERLRAAAPHLTPGENLSPELLRAWHAQAMEQARSALAEIPPTERDMSTMTVALNAAELATAKGWIADLRRQVRAASAACEKPDRVFQVNVQFFPVAQRAKTKRPG